MYTSMHSVVGTATLFGVSALTGSVTAGATAGILSHWALDLFGEKHYKHAYYYEAAFHVLFLITGCLLNSVEWFIGGIIVGNLFDIIDKKLYLSFYDLKRFPYTFYFHKIPVKWELTAKQTKDLVVLASILSVMFSLAAVLGR